MGEGPGRAHSTSGPGPIPPGSRAVAAGTVASLGMVAFGLTAHSPFPYFSLALVGLVLTAAAISGSFRPGHSLTQAFGLTGVTRPVAVGSIAGILLGAGLAALFRFTYDQPLLLTGIRPYVLTAALIGASEELLFRGFIQGKLSSLGWPAAVVLASLAHTAYKLSLFVFPKEGGATNFLVLGFFTLLVGCMLGVLRLRAGSVIPPVAAHAFFDIFAYGDWTQAPWWVWG